MDTRINEIADRIYRLSTLVADIGPTGFTFNQYLIDDDQPLLFHTGPRATFPLVAEAITTITALERLRWITFGHVEADECGSMNRLLAAAPHAQVAHGGLGCTVSLNDLADRPPVALTDGQIIETGHHRLRHIDTPTSPTAGKPECSTKRPPRHSSVATCSPNSATRSPSPQTTSSNPHPTPKTSWATPASHHAPAPPSATSPSSTRRHSP